MTTPNDAPATFDDLARLIQAALPDLTFEVRWGRDTTSIPVEQLPMLFRHPTEQGRSFARRAIPKADEHHWPRIVDALTTLLDDYISRDGQPMIGCGLGLMTGWGTACPVTYFAEALIRASAILGAERAVGLVRNWVAGEPILYTRHIALTGLLKSQPATPLSSGVRLIPLPTSGDAMENVMPLWSTTHFGETYFFGRMMLEIDFQTQPAFFRPNIDPFIDLQRSPVDPTFPTHAQDNLWNALSVACDAYIGDESQWSRYGDLEAFGGTGGGMSWKPTLVTDGDATLSAQQWEHALNILEALRRRDDGDRQRLSLAIHRWRASKIGPGLADRLIDLRVALEILYLGDDAQGELSFRLAIRGAWHLGTDHHERKECERILRKAYKLASRAVHSGEVKDTEENRGTLQQAQNLCRKGILKRLEDGEEPNWDELILGKPPAVPE